MKFIQSALSPVYLHLKLKWSGKTKDIYDFARKIREVKKILVIFPENTELHEDAEKFSEDLRLLFMEASVDTFSVNRLSVTEMNWFQAPNQIFLNEIRKRQYDLLIDLNPQASDLCSYIAANGGAPLRLNLTASRYDFIYNLHIRPNPASPFSDRLKTVLLQLRNLKTK